MGRAVFLARASALIVALAFATAATAKPDGHTSAGAPGAAYVALGDSYSAGEGLGPFEKGTDVKKGSDRNQCHRSVHDAYAVLSPAVVLPDVADRAFFACSGATSADMQSLPSNQAGQPKQSAMVGPNTRYITLSAGGNDVGFGDSSSATRSSSASRRRHAGSKSRPRAAALAQHAHRW